MKIGSLTKLSRLFAGAAAGLLVTSAAPAWAALGTRLEEQIYIFGVGAGESVNNNRVMPDAAPLASNQSLNYGGTDPYVWSASAFGNGYVEPGIIRLSVGSVASHASAPSTWGVGAYAEYSGGWSDTFTIDGGALNGTPGHLSARLRVDGNFTHSFSDDSGSTSYWEGAWLSQGYGVTISMAQNNQNIHYTNAGQGWTVSNRGIEEHDLTTREPGLWTIEADFVFGVPIDLYLNAGVSVYSTTGSFCGGECGEGVLSNASVSATADFGHTIAWGGFASVTSGGNPVTGYTVSSLSGFNYAAPVPEPETWAMMLAGLGLLGGLTRRRPALPA